MKKKTLIIISIGIILCFLMAFLIFFNQDGVNLFEKDNINERISEEFSITEASAVIKESLRDPEYQDELRSSDSYRIKIASFYKSYNATTKTILIETNQYQTIVEMQLTTNFREPVNVGNDTKIAGLYLIDFFNSSENIIDLISSYNVKNNYEEESKIFTLKYKTEWLEETCTNFGNGTNDICENATRISWTEFTSSDELPHKGIEIGVFTDTVLGEEIEWVPTIKGVDILEYASFLVTDIRSYWKMDEQDITGTGKIIDELGVNNGTNVGASNVTGKINTAYDFVGDNDRISLSSSASFDADSNGTISMWVNIDDNADFQGFTRGDDTSTNFMLFSTDNAGLLKIDFNVGTRSIVYAGNILENNQWYHLVLTSNSSVWKIYINGTEANLTVNSGSNNGRWFGDFLSKGFSIGALVRSGTDIFSDGTFDEIGIWSRPLNSTEVSELYNSGIGKQYPFEGELTLNITEPTTASPLSISSGDNISINFMFQNDGVNITTGVTLENITIDGNISNAIEFCEGINSSCSTHVNETYCEVASCTWSVGAGTETIQSFFIGNGGTSNNVFEDLSDTAGSGASNWDSTASGEIRTFVRQYGSGTIITTSSVDVGIWCDKDGAQGGDSVKIDAEFFDCGSSSTCASSPVSICAIASIDCDNGQAGATYETGSCTPATNTTIEAGHYVGFKLVTNTNKNPNPILYYNDTTTPSHINYTIDGGASSCTGISQSCSTFNNSACGIFDTGCNVDNTMFVNGLFWQTNITVPENSGGLKDLFLNATYTGTTKNDTQTNAIDYGGAGDTCTYTSGDWNIDCSDDCSISSPVDVSGNDIFITGTGTFFTNSDITNYGLLHIEGTDTSNICRVTCDGGCFK